MNKFSIFFSDPCKITQKLTGNGILNAIVYCTLKGTYNFVLFSQILAMQSISAYLGPSLTILKEKWVQKWAKLSRIQGNNMHPPLLEGQVRHSKLTQIGVQPPFSKYHIS